MLESGNSKLNPEKVKPNSASELDNCTRQTNNDPAIVSPVLLTAIAIVAMHSRGAESNDMSQSMTSPRYPALIQVHTRVWLRALSRGIGRAATLDDVPDATLDRLAESGFDWVWLLGVWQTGEVGRNVSRTGSDCGSELHTTLPDDCESENVGSCFAVTSYDVDVDLGGNAALARIRERLQSRGVKLMLDFVPNHTAVNHKWVRQQPGYYVAGQESDLKNAPENYCKVATDDGPLVLAHGRDPHFPGWPDTLQLNYGNQDVRERMAECLLAIAGKCDGVRCAMAMLVLPDVFERTWGIGAKPFWPGAITLVRRAHPDIVLLAEVYWGLEWTLQEQGFDFAYDKRLYDRLREGLARPVREHFWAGMDYQNRLARFLENDNEPRAAAVFSDDAHEAAAIITFFPPGMRFFHLGQCEGDLERLSTHRGSDAANSRLKEFYRQLRGVLKLSAFRDGEWVLLECSPEWEQNVSWENFIAFAWEGRDGQRIVVAVNYAATASQCFVRLAFPDLHLRVFKFHDLMHDIGYSRDGNDLEARGLYLDVPPWGYHVFEVERTGMSQRD